jgi:hypothetical protein
LPSLGTLLKWAAVRLSFLAKSKKHRAMSEDPRIEDERSSKRTKLDEPAETEAETAKETETVETSKAQEEAASVAASVAAVSASVAVSSDPSDVALAQIPLTVRAVLENIFASGSCQKHELEACCIDSLKDFTEEEAMAIVMKFQDADLGTVRSKTAFFIGILKRFRRDKASKPQGGYGQAMNNMMGMMGAGNPMAAMQAAANANPAESAEREQALNNLPATVHFISGYSCFAR